MHRFIHIGFAFAGVPKILDMEPVITQVGDWVRYSALSWIVWTDRPTPEIFAKIKPYLDANDQVLIAKLDFSDGFGWLSPWIWTWINSKVPSTVYTGQPLQSALQAYLPPPPPPPWPQGRK
jgi:hypothetical protein